MNNDYQRSVSLRVSRRAERNNQNPQSEDIETGFFPMGKLSQDHPMKIIWKKGFLRLVLVGGILWMFLILTALVFHVWSCQSSLAFFSAIYNRGSKVFIMLDTMGLVPKPPHCKTTVVSFPLRMTQKKIVIPKRRTPSEVVEHLTYITEDVIGDNGSYSPPLFGGHQSWPLINEFPKIDKGSNILSIGYKVMFALEEERERDFAIVLAIPGRLVSYNLKYKTWDVLHDLGESIEINYQYACTFVDTLYPV
ncbi:hypothetical protein Vadar_025420 [Vaccinium darrowii]|uniref:Uncharacterized protein n=1 Tax=Vaccinium darrowii TaxID=229202 RepID=A0ACB7YG11_9ERIC|nr:hypothetical protein Vadar_025420 [Vaccinium darrowii]